MVKGIPLCLPNNVSWDPATGKTQKTSAERSSLYVVPTAVKMLQEIKDPVCVVAIAGPCRDGKSYILGEVFGEMDVFSIGHKMDPETLGLWMWIVPQKYKDSRGRDFTVILLDSEGISSVDSESEDDNQIFTLTVLLASILIYNSKNVPKRNDLNDLSFISKLSQRIRIRSKGSPEEKDLFRNTFPFFVWLLRDVIMELPDDCKDLDDYFCKRVFKVSATKEAQDQNQVAESILQFFSGWQSFALPLPASNLNVMKDVATARDKLDPDFLHAVKRFEGILKSKLTPKRSINRGEYVTGEALAALLQIYTDAINDPDLMPTVESAWETFVGRKCSEAVEKALQIYEQVMKPLSSRLPCDNEYILTSHGEAQRKSTEAFEKETSELISSMIVNALGQLTKSIDEKLSFWKEKNHSLTKQFCEEMLLKLKAEHLDPVLKRVRGPDGAKVNYGEIMNGWNMIKTDFDLKAIGAKDVKADVFFKFNQVLQDEVMKHEEILKNMKDYDENLAKEKIARAFQEKEMRRMEENIAQLNKQDEARRKKMEMVEKKQVEEIKIIKEQSAKEKEDWSKQLKMMEDANMKKHANLEKQLEGAAERERKASKAVKDLQKELDQTKKDAEAGIKAAEKKFNEIQEENAKSSSETAERAERMFQLYTEMEGERNEIWKQMLEEDRENRKFLQKQLEEEKEKYREATKPGFIRWILGKIFG